MWIMSRGENFEGIEATWDKACSSSTYDNDGGDGADDGIYYCLLYTSDAADE